MREGPRNEHTAIGLALRSSRFQKPEGVASALQGQLSITVAKQSLYGFWVSSNADQKRCQAVTQIMEAKSAVDHQRPPLPRIAHL